MGRLILFLMLLCASVALGQNPYWVSPTGAASWASAQSATALSGTSCASLGTMVSNVNAGDTVYLRAGTYDRAIRIGSGNGASGNRITIEAYNGEEVIIQNDSDQFITGYYHGLLLQGEDYVTVKGITFRVATTPGVGDRLMELQSGARFNIIENCTFDGVADNAQFPYLMLRDTNGTNPCTHNWIKGCTFKNLARMGGGASPDDSVTGLQVGTYNIDDESNYNTIEDCDFFYGGHHNLEIFSKYNVVRNNRFHNEGWYDDDGVNDPDSAPDTNGLWGNRNISIFDSVGETNQYGLYEGNRFQWSGPPPDDDGGDNIALASGHNILRYNYIFKAQNNGLLLKYNTSGQEQGNNNRIYNNTFFANGRYDNTNGGSPTPPYTGDLWQGAQIRFYVTFSQWAQDNVIKNNVFHDYGGASEFRSTTGNTLTNNWLQADGDPSFYDETATDATSFTETDLRIQATSGAVDNGTFLTQANGAGAATVTLVVDDAQYFQDGSLGSSLSSIEPDVIAIGTVDNTVAISSIDYATDTITLASEMTWSDNANIWLYSDSTGTRVLYGSAPDQGAYEVGMNVGVTYTGRLRLDNTKRPIKVDGTGRPYIFAN